MIPTRQTTLIAVAVCAFALLVAPLSGAVVNPSPNLTSFRVKHGSELFIRFGGRIPNCIQNSQQIDAAKVKIAFKARGGGYTLSNVWCSPTVITAGGFPYVSGHLRDWRDHGFFFESFPESDSKRDMTLTPSPSAPRVRRVFDFGYWVSINGKLARKGRLRVSLDNRSRIIRQGEDDFINICINDLKKLYSSGGRLYCIHASPNYSMKLLS